MKQIIRTIGQFLVAGIVVVLTFTLINNIFLPGIRTFVGQVFPDEKNLVLESSEEDAPTLSATSTTIKIPVSSYETYNPLDGITAVSSDGESLLPQIEQDLSESKDNRSHIFIYSVTDAGKVLYDEVDRTSPGQWKIFYIVSDKNDNYAKLTVNVEVTD